MIPQQINRTHVELAMGKVDRLGVPKRRAARDWAVLHQGRRYPVKLLVSWGHEFYNGQELDSDEFIATEARQYLQELDFTIINLN